MNRKTFLGAVTTAGAWVALDPFSVSAAVKAGPKKIKVPPYLKPGDTIGITCPSGFILANEIAPAVEQISSWGFQVLQGSTVGKRDFTFGGTDEERRADFQAMIDNPNVKGILCARGGYGVTRIIDQIDFSSFKKHPKWVIGFSDITVFHSHLHARGIATLHSKMCNSFPDDWSKAEPVQVETILSIRDALQGKRMEYHIPADLKNRNGSGEGQLVGGNLKMLETLAGTASDISTDNKILFVEDVGEALYNIDRMFCNLLRTGKLNKLAGLLIGGFTSIKPETTGDEFGRTVYDIVMEKVGAFPYPVCFGFPVGHQRNNMALKCGVVHRLEVGERGAWMGEIRK